MGREDILKTIGKEILYQDNTDAGVRIVTLAQNGI